MTRARSKINYRLKKSKRDEARDPAMNSNETESRNKLQEKERDSRKEQDGLLHP